MKKKYFLSIFAISLIFYSCQVTSKDEFSAADISVIPKPVELILNKGYFTFNDKTKIIIYDESIHQVVIDLQQKFKMAAGMHLELAKENSLTSNVVKFIKDTALEKEMYHLTVTSKSITITASTNSGFLYGVQTLVQLLPEELESKSLQEGVNWRLPNVVIKDKPRFPWRGLMLDVSRHFFDKEYILKTIDRLAAHKMNVLHLHLIDDQGWRLQIKKYPKLTEVGAWRIDKEDLHWNARNVHRMGDTLLYGGFYTQEDIKEIVAYAASKHIEVIPEIEMPAHVTSAIAAYPEYSCNDIPVEVPSGGIWPITDIYCAGKEETFVFLEDILTEVMELFPSKYIHIGGDEATKTNWNSCQYCKNRIKTEHLNGVDELQSYFIKRVEKFINSKGRKLIGWDEILEGGLAPDATVMSWRGYQGGLEAASSGHDVIMTPGEYCYINHYQGPHDLEPIAQGGYLPLNKVYAFDPVHESMTEKEAKHVLGGQANLWSEYVSTTSHSEYMIFPRLAAMSESLWSSKENKDWNGFANRLLKMLNRYRYQGINYSESAFLITDSTQFDSRNNTINLSLQTEFPNSDIRYVLNNDNLISEAIPYSGTIVLDKTSTITASLFRDNEPVGQSFNKTIKFHKAMAKKVHYVNRYNDRYKGTGVMNLVDGLRGTKNFFDGKWQGWLGESMEVIVDLGGKAKVKSVSIGALEDQGSDIYFPVGINIYISDDGINYVKRANLVRPYKTNPNVGLEEFKLDLEAEVETNFIKITVDVLPMNPDPNRGVWLFIDEIIID
ncbi:MAG: family 20 glycosylhydrolase [Flavobacteriaceae bacterium]